MQINTNSIIVLNALFILGFLHDKDLGLNFVTSAYDIKTTKYKVYLTFCLQPKRGINFFARLSTSDKTWDDDLKGLYAISRKWSSLTIIPK